jgi:hypothetical protein
MSVYVDYLERVIVCGDREDRDESGVVVSIYFVLTNY